ncbi:MAG: hypothetical protein COS85_06295 [Armatimonadetes bacterium CG07_land_8_20_14_0_80_59_28]|nr:MAG: hypothetical protein COS85_06295 [Armatimonadetes bacterium CG07_land_8_20_14_0_80_59_28]
MISSLDSGYIPTDSKAEQTGGQMSQADCRNKDSNNHSDPAEQLRGARRLQRCLVNSTADAKDNLRKEEEETDERK